MSNKRYYGKFPRDIGSGTSFPYHPWTNIPKLQFLNSQAGYSAVLSFDTQCSCRRESFSLRKMCFPISISDSPSEGVLLHNEMVWGNCNKRQEREIETPILLLKTLTFEFCFLTTTALGFGCTAGAFSYSSLHQKKCQDAGGDYGNPNIYNALDNIKVNYCIEIKLT